MGFVFNSYAFAFKKSNITDLTDRVMHNGISESDFIKKTNKHTHTHTHTYVVYSAIWVIECKKQR